MSISKILRNKFNKVFVRIVCLYWLPRATVTNFHTKWLNIIGMHCLTVLEERYMNSGCSKIQTAFRGSKENFLSCLFCLLMIPSGSWLVATERHGFLFCTFLFAIGLKTQLDNPGFCPHLKSLNLVISWKDLFYK